MFSPLEEEDIVELEAISEDTGTVEAEEDTMELIEEDIMQPAETIVPE